MFVRTCENFVTSLENRYSFNDTLRKLVGVDPSWHMIRFGQIGNIGDEKWESEYILERVGSAVCIVCYLK